MCHPSDSEHQLIDAAIRVLPSSGDDRAIALPTPRGYLLAVADGAGVTGGGPAAADRVVPALSKRAQESSSIDWFTAICEIDDDLSSNRLGGQTTGVVASLEGNRIRGASVGDSVAWLIPGVGAPIDLTERQRRKPLIGSGEALPVEFGTECGGHRILLATDGLVKYASVQQICALAMSGTVSAAVDALVEAVRLPSGGFHDDVGIVLLSV